MMRQLFASRTLVLSAVFILRLGSSVRAQIDVGSDGTDGAFGPSVNYVFNLSQAASLCNCDNIDQGNDGNYLDDLCRWDCPSPVAGKGVYDSDQHAIVFKYTSVSIPSGVTVSFDPNNTHPSGAPVAWLVDGAVVVTGIIDVNGATGVAYPGAVGYAVPGPGGFRGGRRTEGVTLGSWGFGPGGDVQAHGGSYATRGAGAPPSAIYGNDAILPLIGGSGGAAVTSDTRCSGGGAGGGAILIAANTSITVGGTIRANGGNGGGGYFCGGGGGSGGAIRLIADTISGAGSLSAQGGGADFGSIGGNGRIRVEGNQVNVPQGGSPLFVQSLPTFVFPPSPHPHLQATKLNSVDVPSEPAAKIGDTATVDMSIATASSLPLDIEAEGIPAGTVVKVFVRGAANGDSGGYYNSTPLVAGQQGKLTATANVTFPSGFSVVQLGAYFTPVVAESSVSENVSNSHDSAPRTLIGERVIRTEIMTTANGKQEIVYVTDRGRRIPVGQ